MLYSDTAVSRKVVGKSAHDNAESKSHKQDTALLWLLPKGIVRGFEFTVLQRNLQEWH